MTGKTISRPSMNEMAAARSQRLAGAANGKRRRPRSTRTTAATAGAANHVGVVGSLPGSSLRATSSAAATAPSTITTSNACLRRSGNWRFTA